jgi:hypothetical protein
VRSLSLWQSLNWNNRKAQGALVKEESKSAGGGEGGRGSMSKRRQYKSQYCAILLEKTEEKLNFERQRQREEREGGKKERERRERERERGREERKRAGVLCLKLIDGAVALINKIAPGAG